MQPRELDLTFNPFDDNNDEPTPQNRQYFGSAFLPNVQTPTTRRRSSVGSTDTSSSTIRKRHVRSRTEFNLDLPEPSTSSTSGHPLKSAALKSATFQDFDITRPNLSRIVRGPGALSRSLSYGGEDSDELSPMAEVEEKEVIIHQVTSKDSLAGVSLKYGIPLPELRRANQLWANDSIHLRKVLYIPLDRARRAHEYIAARNLSASPTSEDAFEPLHDWRPQSTTSDTPTLRSPSGSAPSPELPEIRKIPASQLSFFPPSAQTSRTNTPGGTPSPMNGEFAAVQRPAYMQHVNPGTRSGSSPAHSLTSLLNALPIAASTRDEIVSRLSFDSVSSSYSERPRSRVPSDEEVGHEMDDVNKSTSSSKRSSPDPDFRDVLTPRPSVSGDIPLRSNIRTRNASPSSKPTASTTSRPLMMSTSPPSSYIAQQTVNPYVRTQQLEPSPAMQLPGKANLSQLGRSQSLGRATSKGYIKRAMQFNSAIAEVPGAPIRKSRDQFEPGIELGSTGS